MNDHKKCVKIYRSYDDTYQVQVVSWYDNENSYTLPFTGLRERKGIFVM